MVNPLSAIRRGVSNPRTIPNHLKKLARVKYHRYRSDDWNEFFIRMRKQDDDFKELVGPGDLFEELAQWQFEWVRNHGLSREDTLVDVGCGVLRGGVPIIRYLEPEKYYGLDISERTLSVARDRLREHGLQHKRPHLIKNDDLQFQELDGVKADFVLCQSVWTHIPPEYMEEFFENIGKVLNDEGVVLATYYEGSGSTPETHDDPNRSEIDWFYPWSWLSEQADENGLEIERLDREHPNNLDVCRVVRKR